MVQKICNVNTSTSVLSALKNLAQKMRKTKMRLKLAQHYAQPIFRGQRNAQGMGKTAFMYYDSWWDKDRNRWDRSHLRPSQTTTNHSSQFVCHYYNAVPKVKLLYKESQGRIIESKSFVIKGNFALCL